jgi:hypothetical protein
MYSRRCGKQFKKPVATAGSLVIVFVIVLLLLTSHGVIVFRVDGDWKPPRILSDNESAITDLEGSGQVKPLIERKDGLGFVELMRGKYQLDDYRY